MLTICGTTNANHSGLTEWFPVFNHHLVNYLMQNSDAKHQTRSSDNGKYELDELGCTLTVNANNLALVDQTGRRVLLFTTFWNLQQLVDENRELFATCRVTVFSGHYNSIEVDHILGQMTVKPTVKPWMFRPLYWTVPDLAYRPEIEGMYFNGLMIGHSREFVRHLQQYGDARLQLTIADDHSQKLKPDEYFSLCCRYRLCLGAPGVRDMCNRDIEFFKLGIPMIRPRFSSRLSISIPDDVYIPVDCETYGSRNPRLAGMPRDHEQLARDVYQKFLSVVDNQVLLGQISRNAQSFYRQHFTNERILSETLSAISSHFISTR